MEIGETLISRLMDIVIESPVYPLEFLTITYGIWTKSLVARISALLKSDMVRVIRASLVVL